MIEKLESCPNGCGSLEWAYDAQRCLMCGWDALATDRHDGIPALPGEKGRRYLCQDSDGQWHYLNHARTWQTCPGAGNEPEPHDCMEATQEFRLQNDREWREKLAHLKGENAKLRALLDFQGEPVDGAIDAAYRQFSDRIDQLEAENERLRDTKP